MAAVAAAAPFRLHLILLHPPPPSLILKSLLISKQPNNQPPPILISSSLPFTPLRFFSHSFPAITASSSPSPQVQVQEDQPTQDLVEESEIEEEGETEDGKLDTDDAARMNLDPSTVLKRNRVDPVDLPTLTVREKKELASYANSLGRKLKSQLVGKSGVTPKVAASFVENLESNELLKVKIHGTCPEELDDTVKRLETATGSVVVGRIGRTVILYRPSLTKLKAEEKKEQMRKIFLKRKKRYSRPSTMEFQRKGRPRMFVRDSRGRSKV